MTRSGLRLARATPERIELEGRLPREGPLLVAIGLGVFALVPLLAPGNLTPLRVVGSLALAALAALVGRGSAGRRQRVIIRPGQDELCANGRRYALATARSFVLATSGGADDSAPRISYRVELELADPGSSLTLLEHADPAVVITDLRRLLTQVPLPVRAGWALPTDVQPWREREQTEREAAPFAAIELRAAPLPSQRRAAVTVLGGAVFTLVAMGVMFATRLRRGDSVAALSWSLAIATVAVLLVIGTYVATEQVVVRRAADGVLRVERRVLGRRRGGWEVAGAKLLSAYAVGPSRSDLRHVLVETTEGVRSIPCAGEVAERIAQALRGSAGG
jgi:hypothetical protein